MPSYSWYGMCPYCVFVTKSVLLAINIYSKVSFTLILQDLHLDFECECSRGFEGRFCESELDGCIRQTCLNNGTCQVSIT